MTLFEKNIVNLYGDKGRDWLRNLPHLIQDISQKWNLRLCVPLQNLSYHYVLTAKQKNISVILKIGLDLDALQKEMLALTAFDGHGCIKLLKQDLDQGAILLEKATPGQSLKSFFPEQDPEAVQITTQVISQLQKASPPSYYFPKVEDWLTILNQDFAPLMPYLETGRFLAHNLLLTQEKVVLLHGDLHHDNILSQGKTWIAIDPKGVTGDPLYEVGAFIRNPIPDILKHPQLLEILQTRIQSFAKLLKASPQRLLGWCYVQTILASAWCIEDGLDSVPWLQLTEAFHQLLKENNSLTTYI